MPQGEKKAFREEPTLLESPSPATLGNWNLKCRQQCPWILGWAPLLFGSLGRRLVSPMSLLGHRGPEERLENAVLPRRLAANIKKENSSRGEVFSSKNRNHQPLATPSLPPVGEWGMVINIRASGEGNIIKVEHVVNKISGWYCQRLNARMQLYKCFSTRQVLIPCCEY